MGSGHVKKATTPWGYAILLGSLLGGLCCFIVECLTQSFWGSTITFLIVSSLSGLFFGRWIFLKKRFLHPHRPPSHHAFTQRHLDLLNPYKEAFRSLGMSLPSLNALNDASTRARRARFRLFINYYWEQLAQDIRPSGISLNNYALYGFCRRMRENFDLSTDLICAFLILLRDDLRHRRFLAMQHHPFGTGLGLCHALKEFDHLDGIASSPAFAKRLCWETAILPLCPAVPLMMPSPSPLQDPSLGDDQDDQPFSFGQSLTVLLQGAPVQYRTEPALKRRLALTPIGMIDFSLVNYHFDQSNFVQQSTIDRLYKAKIEKQLHELCAHQCCACQQETGALYLDYFWLPKSMGGNYAMEHRKGYWVNNAVLLCHACLDKRENRLYFNFFSLSALRRLIRINQKITPLLQSIFAPKSKKF